VSHKGFNIDRMPKAARSMTSPCLSYCEYTDCMQYIYHKVT